MAPYIPCVRFIDCSPADLSCTITRLQGGTMWFKLHCILLLSVIATALCCDSESSQLIAFGMMKYFLLSASDCLFSLSSVTSHLYIFEQEVKEHGKLFLGKSLTKKVLCKGSDPRLKIMTSHSCLNQIPS